MNASPRPVQHTHSTTSLLPQHTAPLVFSRTLPKPLHVSLISISPCLSIYTCLPVCLTPPLPFPPSFFCSHIFLPPHLHPCDTSHTHTLTDAHTHTSRAHVAAQTQTQNPNMHSGHGLWQNQKSSLTYGRAAEASCWGTRTAT
jgi:hypothetical protein